MPTSIGSSTDRVQGTTGNVYDAVFTDETDNSILDADQFLNLMVLQMQNQDFTNPMDDTAYITQMAQFANMQVMQEMAEYSRTSYALSFVGKTVTASRLQTNGELDTTTGVVEKVSLVGGDYVFYVGGKTYTMSQIMTVQASDSEMNAGSDDDESQIDIADLELTAGEITNNSISFEWPLPTEDTSISDGLRYSVYYSETGPFDTLEDVKNGICAAMGLDGVTEETIKNLKPNTDYYINVVVKDANGNESIYKTLKATTLSE